MTTRKAVMDMTQSEITNTIIDHLTFALEMHAAKEIKTRLRAEKAKHEKLQEKHVAQADEHREEIEHITEMIGGLKTMQAVFGHDDNPTTLGEMLGMKDVN